MHHHDSSQDPLFAQLQPLVTAMSRGEATDAQTEELERLVTSDRAACQLYLTLIAEDFQLRMLVQSEQLVEHLSVEPADSKPQQATVQPPAQRLVSAVARAIEWHLHPVRFVAVIAMLTLTMWAAWLIIIGSGSHPVANRPSATSGTPDARRPMVARLLRTVDAQWSGSSESPFDGMFLRAGRTLWLQSGLAEIEFDDGAEVILEGPVEFRVLAGDRGQLKVGKLVAKIKTPEAKGFTINTPTTTIVDLGTEFGVDVLADGAHLVSVFQGQVAVDHPSGHDRPTTVHEGQSLVIQAGQETAVVLAKQSTTVFARSLPLGDRPQGQQLLADSFDYDRPDSPVTGERSNPPYAGGSGFWSHAWRGWQNARITGTDHETPNVAEVRTGYLERKFNLPRHLASQPVFVRVDVRDLTGTSGAAARLQFHASGWDAPHALGFGIHHGRARIQLAGQKHVFGQGLADATWHTLVAKIEFNHRNRNDRVTVWVDPTGQQQAEQTRSAEHPAGLFYLGTRLRLYTWARSGSVQWDNLRIGTTWQAVVPEHDTDHQTNVPQPQNLLQETACSGGPLGSVS